MVAKMFTETRPWPKAGALTLAAILLVAELGLIGVIYKHLITFKCLANWPAWACVFPKCLVTVQSAFSPSKKCIRVFLKHCTRRNKHSAIQVGGETLA